MMNALKAIFLTVIFMCCTIGCGKKAYPQFASPVKTVETYLEHILDMSTSINPVEMNKALACFTGDEKRWFKENYHTLDFDPGDQDSYSLYSKAQKQAFVFGEIVASAGPKRKNPRVTEKEVSGETAVVEVDGYNEPIRLVKEGPNWKIKGMFGVN